MSGALKRTQLMDGRVQLDQPERGYRVAVDAVLAASAVPVSASQTVLDVGIGTGAIALCIAARVPEASIVGVENNTEHAAIAARNFALNGCADTISCVTADIFELPSQLRIGFDHVVSNPPYHDEATNRQPDNPSKRAAGHRSVPLVTWIDACIKRVKSGGSLTLVHKCEALPDILAGLGERCGSVEIFPVWSRAHSAYAKRIIVRARKGHKGPLRLARGLILHSSESGYTDAGNAILRDGRALENGICASKQDRPCR